MTSLLRSSFDFGGRRAACLIGDRLVVYHWRRGQPADPLEFDNSEEGLMAFARYLYENPEEPIYFLVDMLEEEYRLDTIPHVFGPDRAALLNRKLNRLFRDTPYRYSELQGRESSGRRDDRLLLTALTKPDLLGPWLRIMDSTRTPLAGIYSRALLTPLLVRGLGLEQDNSLVINLFSPNRFRQTFFSDGYLKMSRLGRLPRYRTAPYGPILLEEAEKVRRYLSGQRLLSHAKPLQITVVTGLDVLEELQQRVVDSEQVRYRLIDVQEAARRLGLRNIRPTVYSDALFVHLLLSERPPNQYATDKERRYHSLNRLRSGMMAAAVLLLLVSAGVSGINLMRAVSYHDQAALAARKAAYYEQRYQAARARLPKTPVEPRHLETAVKVVQALQQHRTTPRALMVAVSRVLNDYPRLRLEAMQWLSSEEMNARLPGEPERELPPGSIAVGEGEPGARYQIARLDGFVDPFEGDYREAIALINDFTEHLRKAPGIARVEIARLPIDLGSDTVLKGDAREGSGQQEGKFSLRVVLREERHETG